MNNKIYLFIFAAIFIVAFLFRFIGLSTNPPALTWDEASWGYNAYTLGIDGKDEFGRFLPLTNLESFGDFKPPVYAYLSVIPVKIFGLNEFSTRFTSAFLGVGSVVLTFFLTKSIFHTLPKRKKIELGLIASLILAISPWHIMLSRGAFEANVATFFIILGILLFTESLKRRFLLPLSVLAFVISMYTFNTARIVAPIVLVALTLFNLKSLLISKRNELIISVILGAVVFLPLFLFLMTPQAKLRYNEVNIFTDGAVVTRSNQEIQNDNNALWSKILHNRRIGYTQEYLKHYFDNLSPNFLFVTGDGNPKFSIQSVGQLYLFEIPLVIAGLLFIFRKREGHWWVVPFLLFVGILPAATARETPHALRIETILPTFQILSAIGAFYLLEKILSIRHKIKGIKLGFFVIIPFLLIAIFNVVYFSHNYFVHYPKEFSGEWQYGYKEAIAYVKSVESEYERIVFTEDLGRPYIYALFYEKYDPLKFRQEAIIEREALGFVHVESFGKYEFEKNVKNNIDKNKKTLYVDSPNTIPEGAKMVREFKLLNGSQILVAYTYE